jgi:hypothetical protein
VLSHHPAMAAQGDGQKAGMARAEADSGGARRRAAAAGPGGGRRNFSDVTQSVDAGIIARAGIYRPRLAHSTTGEFAIHAGRIELSPWSFAWVTGE